MARDEADAGRRADVVVTFPWDDDPNRAPQLAPDAAGAIESMRIDVEQDVPGALPVLCAVAAAAASVRGASVGPYRLGGVLREG